MPNVFDSVPTEQGNVFDSIPTESTQPDTSDLSKYPPTEPITIPSVSLLSQPAHRAHPDLNPLSIAASKINQTIDEHPAIKGAISEAQHDIQPGMDVATRLSKAIPADIASSVYDLTQSNPNNPSFGGNINAALTLPKKNFQTHTVAPAPTLPIDTALSEAAKEEKFRGEAPIASTMGKVSEGVAGSAPFMLAFDGLPAAAQKAAAIAFTAKMASEVPGIAKQLGEEYGKDEKDRDPDKISSLISEGIQTVGFSALGGLGIKRGLADGPIQVPERNITGRLLEINKPRGFTPQQRLIDIDPQVISTTPLDPQTGSPIEPQASAPLSPQELLDRQSRVTVPQDAAEPPIKTWNLDEGGSNASEVPSTESTTQREVRPPVGEGTPLRQPGKLPAHKKPMSQSHALAMHAEHLTKKGHK